MIENHIYKFGTTALDHISENAINDPILYIKTIIDIRQQFLSRFCIEPGFNIALDKACSKFINNNDVKTKSVELLVRYYDKLLKEGYSSGKLRSCMGTI
ncbi:unnamed protein product [Rotaria sp. Silwood1]|nr:unnamed protein product [Rotaria sp. Silwood1]CAF1616662.1 unnamed protein product [Rotaria sp. Silwood1]CAF3759038.1 unnamed protein product [Rotaria sp. Silwood1]CAF4880097.1 unnamed protein product [Rotaria sp. Silwood1]CAF4905358.1 unnamed protein product [Rotaria sp. Silwood1]